MPCSSLKKLCLHVQKAPAWSQALGTIKRRNCLCQLFLSFSFCPGTQCIAFYTFKLLGLRKSNNRRKSAINVLSCPQANRKSSCKPTQGAKMYPEGRALNHILQQLPSCFYSPDYCFSFLDHLVVPVPKVCSLFISPHPCQIIALHYSLASQI